MKKILTTITLSLILLFTSTTLALAYIKGDVNDDNKITIMDAVKIARSIVGLETLTNSQKLAADYDGNGKVTIMDAQRIAIYLVNPVANISTVSPVNITTTTGTVPVLPSTVAVTMNDGTTKTVNVTWDSIDSPKYASAGTFTLNGTIAESTEIKAVATVTVVNSVTTEPVVTINTNAFTTIDGLDVICAKLDALTGTITGNIDLSEITMVSTNGNLEISKANIAPSANWSLPNPVLMVGRNTVTITAKAKNGKIGLKTITLMNTAPENAIDVILDENDDDNDRLLNYQEIFYNTDKTKSDTDGDYLTDYQEIVLLGTDPLKPDTDDNGVLDKDEDFDSDSVSNFNELRLNGNSRSEDTDLDGLKDGQEVSNGTAIDNIDTDNDKLNDNVEIEKGTNPLVADTDGDGILDGDETFSATATSLEVNEEYTIKPSVSLDLKGEQLETLGITEISKDDTFLSSDIPGYLGNAFDFNVAGEFTQAKISFEFETPVSLLSEPSEFEPRIYYFNEENQILEELPNQTITGNIATATVTHFSKYILLNKIDFDKVWEEKIKAPNVDENNNVKPIDMVFAIDSSGSMTNNDRDGLRKVAAKEFIAKLNDNDRGAVVDFDSYAYLRAGLTSDKTILNNAIMSTDDSGGTAIYAGLQMALDQYRSTIPSMARSVSLLDIQDDYLKNTQVDTSEIENPTANNMQIESSKEHGVSLSATETRDASKYIIILTDGEDNYSYDYTPLIQTANAKGVKIYTIGLGSSVNVNLLTSIANGTGGQYYHATAAGELTEIFNDVAEVVVDTDSDSDGISDYYEDKINEGKIRLGTGKVLSVSTPLDKNMADTDGDGLKDGQEIEMILSADQKTIKSIKMNSDPTLPDTDGDGINDGDGLSKALDPEPLTFNITDRVLSFVAGFSYNNVSAYKNKKIKDIPDDFEFSGIKSQYRKIIEDAAIIATNESGLSDNDPTNFGLGAVAVRIKRFGRNDAVVLGYRGTEPTLDGFNDWSNNIILGLGWDSPQTKEAFSEYAKVANELKDTVDYFVTGHSLGGRIVQDVIYKTYNENEGFLWWKKSLPAPVHSATFNGLGYNGIVYATLENDLLAQYKDKLTNYYYFNDMVGHSLGANPWGTYKRAGTDASVMHAKKEDGTLIPLNPTIYDFNTVHDIGIFHYDANLIYPTLSKVY